MDEQEIRFKIWAKLDPIRESEQVRFREHVAEDKRLIIEDLLLGSMTRACAVGVELGFDECYRILGAWLLEDHGIELPPREPRFRSDAHDSTPEGPP